MAVIEAIATTYLEADASSVTFTSIPQTYEHLQFRMSGRCGRTSREGQMLLNGEDSGSLYSMHRMGGSAGSVNQWDALARDYIIGPYCSGTETTAATYADSIVDILDYTNTNKNTTMIYTTFVQGTPDIFMGSALLDSTAALTSLTYEMSDSVSEQLTRGSVFTLYGLNGS